MKLEALHLAKLTPMCCFKRLVYGEGDTYIHVLSSSKAQQIKLLTQMSLMLNYDSLSQIFIPKGYPFHWPTTHTHPFHQWHGQGLHWWATRQPGGPK